MSLFSLYIGLLNTTVQCDRCR